MNCVVVVELRPVIGSCQFFVKFGQQVDDVSEVVVESNKVFIKGSNGDSIIAINIGDMRIIDGSISGVRISSVSAQFRLRIEPNKVFGCFENEIILKEKNVSSPKKDCFSDYKPQITEGKDVIIYCRNCSSPLVEKPLTFRRVLPLPTTFDACDFFCHGGPNNSSIDLKSEDCLYGPYFFQINIPTTHTSSNEVISCKNCSAWLGVTERSSSLFWNSSVKLAQSEIDVNVNIGLKDFLSVINSFLMKDRAFISKVIYFSKVSDSETNYLLIWFIEKSLSLLMNENSTSAEIYLKETKVSKVLYEYQTERTDMVKEWENEMNSMTIQISKQMMEGGLVHIREMSENIPEEFKKVNQLNISYLMLL